MDVNVSGSGLKAKRNAIVERTLRWWDSNRRELPWRAAPGKIPDPYRVWLSEVLLQQTTAQAAAPYFQRFVDTWPTVEDLAAASTEAVIGVFAGLGYYSRARNLHACAKEIARRGQFPDEEAALRALPGVGDYTAAAIAAIAFGRRAAPVDGNIARILSRLLALDLPIAQAKAGIRAAAAELAPNRRAGDFAQALMDIGATICRPRSPLCAACPLNEDCAARDSGAPEAFPRRPIGRPKSRRTGTAFFAYRTDGGFLARRRPPRGLLASTVELPGSPWTSDWPRRGLGIGCSGYSPMAQTGWRSGANIYAFRVDINRLRGPLCGGCAGRTLLGSSGRGRAGRNVQPDAQGGHARDMRRYCARPRVINSKAFSVKLTRSHCDADVPIYRPCQGSWCGAQSNGGLLGKLDQFSVFGSNPVRFRVARNDRLRASFEHVTTWIFDLDNTLYPQTAGSGP